MGTKALLVREARSTLEIQMHRHNLGEVALGDTIHYCTMKRRRCLERIKGCTNYAKYEVVGLK